MLAWMNGLKTTPRKPTKVSGTIPQVLMTGKNRTCNQKTTQINIKKKMG